MGLIWVAHAKVLRTQTLIICSLISVIQWKFGIKKVQL